MDCGTDSTCAVQHRMDHGSVKNVVRWWSEQQSAPGMDQGFWNLFDRKVKRFRCANKDRDPFSGRAKVREMLRKDHLESMHQAVRDGVKESLEGVDNPRGSVICGRSTLALKLQQDAMLAGESWVSTALHYPKEILQVVPATTVSLCGTSRRTALPCQVWTG